MNEQVGVFCVLYTDGQVVGVIAFGRIIVTDRKNVSDGILLKELVGRGGGQTETVSGTRRSTASDSLSKIYSRQDFVAAG